MRAKLAFILALGLLCFSSTFVMTTHGGLRTVVDRGRQDCRAAAAAVVDSPKHLHVVGTTNSGGETAWELRVRRAGRYDSYVMIEDITPTLIDGKQSLFVKTSIDEQVFRTRLSEDGKIRFRHKASFGRVDEGHPSPSNGRVPFRYPVSGKSEVVQADGNSPFLGRDTHPGDMRHAVDIAADFGATVSAGKEGVVMHAVDGYPDAGCYLPELEGRSNLVVIRHDDGSEAVYGHLMRNSVVVSVGDVVKKGQAIASVGNSGMSSLPHLHFHVGGLSKGGYRTLPLLFEGCSGGHFLPTVGAVHCE